MDKILPSTSNSPSMEPDNYNHSEISKMSTERLAGYIQRHLVHPSAHAIANFVKSFQVTGRDFVALTDEDVECMLQGDEGLPELVALKSSMSGSTYNATHKNSPHLQTIFPECSRTPTPPTIETSRAPRGRGESSSCNESLHLKLDTLTWNFEDENILLSEVPFSPDHLHNPSPQQRPTIPITYIDDTSDVILSPDSPAQSIHPEFSDNSLASPSPIPLPEFHDSLDETSLGHFSVTGRVETTDRYDESDYYEYPSSDEEEAHALSNASVYAASCKTPPSSNIEQADDLYTNEDVSADINDYTIESRRSSTGSSSSSEICLSRAAQTARNTTSLLNAPSSPIDSSPSSPPPRSPTLHSSSYSPLIPAIQNGPPSPMPMLSSLVCIRPDEASYSITAPPATSSSSELSTASQHSYFPFNRSQLSSGGATAGDPSASFDYPFYHQSPNESQLPAPAEYLFTERESSFAALDHDWEHNQGDRQTSSYLVDGAQGPSVDIEERPKDGVTRSTLPPTILWTLPEDTGLSLLDHQDFSPYDTPEPTWTHPAPSPQGSTRRKVLSSRVSNSQRPFFGQNTNFLDRTSRSHETRSRNTDKGKRRPSPNYNLCLQLYQWRNCGGQRKSAKAFRVRSGDWKRTWPTRGLKVPGHSPAGASGHGQEIAEMPISRFPRFQTCISRIWEGRNKEEEYIAPKIKGITGTDVQLVRK